MNTDHIIQQIDEEIERLTRAQTLLTEGNAPASRGPGRPRGSSGQKMSAEGRAKIAAAQRKRWAKQRQGSQ